MTFTVGIISDTHGLLRPEALRFPAHVDHIIHGGDIGDPGIIPTLRRIAPVTAIRGNVDTGEWATEFAENESVRLAGRLFYVLHDLNTLQVNPAAEGIDVIVSGHSHVPKIATVDGALYPKFPGGVERQAERLRAEGFARSQGTRRPSGRDFVTADGRALTGGKDFVEFINAS